MFRVFSQVHVCKHGACMWQSQPIYKYYIQLEWHRLLLHILKCVITFLVNVDVKLAINWFLLVLKNSLSHSLLSKVDSDLPCIGL